jgi:hypothetical protein
MRNSLRPMIGIALLAVKFFRQMGFAKIPLTLEECRWKGKGEISF